MKKYRTVTLKLLEFGTKLSYPLKKYCKGHDIWCKRSAISTKQESHGGFVTWIEGVTRHQLHLILPIKIKAQSSTRRSGTFKRRNFFIDWSVLLMWLINWLQITTFCCGLWSTYRTFHLFWNDWSYSCWNYCADTIIIVHLRLFFMRWSSGAQRLAAAAANLRWGPVAGTAGGFVHCWNQPLLLLYTSRGFSLPRSLV